MVFGFGCRLRCEKVCDGIFVFLGVHHGELDIELVHSLVIAPTAPLHDLSLRDAFAIGQRGKRSSQTMIANYSDTGSLTAFLNV